MGWKKHPYKYRWNHKKLDMDKLRGILLRIRRPTKKLEPSGATVYYAMKFERDLEVGSILCDMTYGAMFDTIQELEQGPMYDTLMGAMEELYIVADIGTLAQEHIDRERKERAWMIEKGFANA